MTYLLHIINNNMKKQYGMTETSYGFGNGGRPFIPRFTEEAKYSAMSYYPKKKRDYYVYTLYSTIVLNNLAVDTAIHNSTSATAIVEEKFEVLCSVLYKKER